MSSAKRSHEQGKLLCLAILKLNETREREDKVSRYQEWISYPLNMKPCHHHSRLCMIMYWRWMHEWLFLESLWPNRRTKKHVYEHEVAKALHVRCSRSEMRVKINIETTNGVKAKTDKMEIKTVNGDKNSGTQTKCQIKFSPHFS